MLSSVFRKILKPLVICGKASNSVHYTISYFVYDMICKACIHVLYNAIEKEILIALP